MDHAPIFVDHPNRPSAADSLSIADYLYSIGAVSVKKRKPPSQITWKGGHK